MFQMCVLFLDNETFYRTIPTIWLVQYSVYASHCLPSYILSQNLGPCIKRTENRRLRENMTNTMN